MAADGEVNFVKWLMLSRSTLKRQGGVFFYVMFGSIGVYHAWRFESSSMCMVSHRGLHDASLDVTMARKLVLRLPC